MRQENDYEINQLKEDRKNREPVRIIYIGFTVFFLLGIGLCFYYIYDQARNNIDWAVTSEENIKSSSFFNRDCSDALETLASGKANTNEIQKNMQKYVQFEHAKIFLSGIKAFAIVQEKVSHRDEIEFSELAERYPEIRSFFNNFASYRSTKEEMIYPTFLASDLIVYIFNNRDILDIHLNDSVLSDSDEECLTEFYQLAFVVFDYQKNLFNKHLNKSDFYHNTSTFDLMALTLYSKAVAATQGKNDKQLINEIIQTIDQNKFKVGGEKGRWYKWLKDDLEKIKDSTFFHHKISNRPPDVKGRWLI